MQRTNIHHQRDSGALHVHSYWSEDDGVFLAEVEGVPGTRTHADDERDARQAALNLAQEWKRLKTESKDMTLAEFSAWMHLSNDHAKKLKSDDASGKTRRSLQGWTYICNALCGS